MSLDLLIRGGTLVTPSGPMPADLGVQDGQIVSLALEVYAPARQEVDARGLHVFPGVVDAHVHLNEPGRTHWEGFDTGTRALAAGGATSFLDMPLNSSPPVLNRAAFQAKRAAGEAHSRLDFGLWGGLTPLNLSELDDLAACGVVGFKAFMSHSGLDEFPAADDATLYEGMRAARRLGRVVATHAESDPLTRALAQAAQAAGHHGARDYLASRPPITEAEAVSRALLFAEETGAALHLVHLSTARAVLLAAEARARGVDVTAETCPHYLHFTDEDVERAGPLLKCAPPLRPATEREALWAALKAGQIDTVGSDHSPAPPDLKTGDDFFALWGGISGAQSTLNVLLEDGYWRRGVPLPLLAAVSALHPARRFRLARKGALRVGHDADFALVRLDEPFTLTDLHDRHGGNPYRGERFRGRVQATYLRGQPVYRLTDQGAWFGDGRGQLLTPAPLDPAPALPPPGGP
ncbi:allantoinase [Deinococcus multiflagellatus]|uniref:allantoinase n=1 Tax=Deinococcus multiflagellatus TaxID=1656887 RepID=UPI001CCADD3D|nr:allantoinase [Deinococcus multiflagellatus]MBZ9714996.1 allantoinase [Deinococcus multiflagellatus]